MKTSLYKFIAKQDKLILRQFTTEYLDKFVYKQNSNRDRWYIVDLIHIGRWFILRIYDPNDYIASGGFWDNNMLSDDEYHELMFDLLFPGEWK